VLDYLPEMVLVYFTKNAPTSFQLDNTQKAAQKSFMQTQQANDA
jgi:hypothetical protein